MRTRSITALVGTAAVAGTLALAPAGVASAHDRQHHDRDADVAVTQTNLVSDQTGQAPLVDPSLVNPWGMSFGTGATATPLWVSDNGADVATLYRGDTTPPSFAKVPLTVSIPGGAPTGQVFNPSATEFVVSNGGASGPAKFIFASEAGMITGWNPTVPAAGSTQAQIGATVKDAVFKGLALAQTGGKDYLYAADFHHGTIDVFNTSFTLQHWAGAFRDTHLPHGYAPFNIVLLKGDLYVSYAKQDAAKHDDVAGRGHGFIDVFNRDGHFENRLVSRDGLNSPWGMTIAPSSWGNIAGALLVGNFGNGRIHAYDAENGRFEGVLRNAHGDAITIDGLWGLMPGNGVAADPQQIIFSAGPDGEQHGLVGVLQGKATPDGDDR